MKLSIAAALLLLQVPFTIAANAETSSLQSRQEPAEAQLVDISRPIPFPFCPCPRGFSLCTKCSNIYSSEEKFVCQKLCTSRCYDLQNDPKNCGKCDLVCPSGKCENGECVPEGCQGGYCGDLPKCGENCYCFKHSPVGFCGPDVACSALADCKSDYDCPKGVPCLESTCCGRNVCLPSMGCEKGIFQPEGSFTLAKSGSGERSAAGSSGGSAASR